MKQFVYKSRQEELLIDYISSSKITTKEILLDVKKYYNDNPYHNFLHALQVASNVLILSLEDFSILEIRTLFYAALFHDALHKWNAELLDEFNSYDIAVDYLIKNEDKIWIIDFSILRRAIVGTVFKNRGKYTDKYAVLLWDLDILSNFKDIYNQLYYWDILCFELWVDIEKWVEDFSFFRYCLNISKNVFLSPYILEKFPNAAWIVKQRISISKDSLIDMLEVLRDEDITLDEFRDRFVI